MTKSLRLSLKSGETLFLNGAVIRVDRRVSLELLNDAQFLLSQHVVNASDTTTPLKQLYYIIQTMLMVPDSVADAQRLYHQCMIAIAQAFDDHSILAGLVEINRHIEAASPYDALKALRRLLPREAELLAHTPTSQDMRAIAS
jgi:flagellar biosynthesis repressor protein FlbT